MTGNYATYNLSNEEAVSQFIYEANAGVRLSNKKDAWLDAGIMPSHIGFETAVGIDCWNLTRSILAENSPYYETEVRISYKSSNKKFYSSLLYLNGWQHIRRPAGIQKPSAGVQLNYQFNVDVSINYSNFIESDKPDSLHALRTYHNFYFIYDRVNKTGFIIGFDIGTDKKPNRSYGSWFSPIVIARIGLSKKLTLAGRAEYFSDKNQLIISTTTPTGFQTWSFSINLDYSILKNLIWRIETRNFISKDRVFITRNSNKKNNQFITSSLCIKL